MDVNKELYFELEKARKECIRRLNDDELMRYYTIFFGRDFSIKMKNEIEECDSVDLHMMDHYLTEVLGVFCDNYPISSEQQLKEILIMGLSQWINRWKLCECNY